MSGNHNQSLERAIKIVEAAKEAGAQNRTLVKQQTADFVKKLEDAGMEIVYPDLKPFQEATSGVKEMFSTIYGQDLLDYLETEIK